MGDGRVQTDDLTPSSRISKIRLHQSKRRGQIKTKDDLQKNTGTFW